MKVSFSLNKAKPAPVAATSALKGPTAFSSLEDDDTIDAAPTASSSSKTTHGTNKALAAQAAERITKAQKRRIEAEKQVDATVYEYDEVWDRMQDAKTRQKAMKEKETQERQVGKSIPQLN